MSVSYAESRMTHSQITRSIADEYPTAVDAEGFVFSTKYATRNRIARRLLDGFAAAFDDLVARSNATSVFEVGCGEGYLSLRLARRGLEVDGIDLRAEAVEIAMQNAGRAGVTHRLRLRPASIYDLTPAQVRGDLVVCCEVLEHLPDPERALDILADITRGHLLISVPREPLWRLCNLARGSYMSLLGNTPGHVNHWSARAFARFLHRRFVLVAVRQPLPWTIALCRAK